MPDFLTYGMMEIFKPMNFLLVLGGSFLGIAVGAIPGLTATLAITLLLPLTFGMDAIPALVLFLGIYNGSMYGGSITAILVNTPGTPGAAATLLDGYPMARKGRAGEALGISCIGSAIGGLFSAVVMIILSEKIAFMSLKFSGQEFFAVSLFGLSIIVSLSDDVIKGILAGLLGVAVGFIGIESTTGVARYTFGITKMLSGVNLIPVIIGLFAVAEVLRVIETNTEIQESDIGKVNRIVPPKKIMIRLIPAFLRASVIGTLIGIVPGAGANLAGFVSYSEEKRASKTPEQFGQGIEEGVAAPETANNAITGGCMIPMLTLGIPGDAVTAVLLSALMIQGFAPGPLLFKEHMNDMVYPLYAAMILTNLAMLVMGLSLARPLARIALVPKKYLIPSIAVLSLIGAFASSGYLWELGVALVFGFLGYLLSKLHFDVMPIVLGLMLGTMVERYYQQAMILAKGDWSTFFTRPISCVFLVLAFLSVALSLRKDIKKNWMAAPVAESSDIG